MFSLEDVAVYSLAISFSQNVKVFAIFFGSISVFSEQKWLIFQDMGKHFPSLVNDSWLWRIWRKSETEKYFVWIHVLFQPCSIRFPWLKKMTPEINAEFYRQTCQVFISSIFDPLQKQLDCHQVTARNNFKVRLTQKFLFLDE